MTKIYSLILVTSSLFAIGCNTDSSKSEDSKVKIAKASEINRTEKSSINQPSNITTTNESYTFESTVPKRDVNLGTSSPIDVTIEEIVQNTSDIPHSETVIKKESDPIKITQETEKIDIHKYEKLNTFLRKYVSTSGKVNYSDIKTNKLSLEIILKEIESNYQQSNWTNNQKLAYWINVYNIYTIKLVVDNYPTNSITKITSEPWKKKFIKLGGSTMSLAHVENEIIRKKFNEPRVHFALNCASKSCPNLLNAAYTPSNIQSKLTSQTKKFLDDTSKNEFDKKEISISKIFDWYAADFNKIGTTIDFINKYRTEQLNSPKVEYKEYSWDLNN